MPHAPPPPNQQPQQQQQQHNPFFQHAHGSGNGFGGRGGDFGGPGGNGGPQSFNMSGGSPPPHRGDERSGSKLVLDLKLARIENHLYSDSRPETWHTHVRAYLVGRHDDMGTFLDWIEGRGNDAITYTDLQSLSSGHSGGDGLMMTMDPVGAAKELWSWLNLTLTESTRAQQTFRSVAELNGAEVYRKLVVPLGTSKPAYRQRLFFHRL